jgi:hypothetical protein
MEFNGDRRSVLIIVGIIREANHVRRARKQEHEANEKAPETGFDEWTHTLHLSLHF